MKIFCGYRTNWPARKIGLPSSGSGTTTRCRTTTLLSDYFRTASSPVGRDSSGTTPTLRRRKRHAKRRKSSSRRRLGEGGRVAQTSVCGFPLELGWKVDLGGRGRPGSANEPPQTEVCAT